MDEKDEKIVKQAKRIAELEATVAELQDVVKELRRQLSLDSHNSSKPPSSDGLKKVAHTRSLRKQSGRKPGGQEGHRGAHMAIPHEPDEVKQHLPAKCQICPHLTDCLAKGGVFDCAEKRYEVNVVIKTKVTEHQAMKVEHCPCGEEGLRGSFPENVKAYVQYGNSVGVLATMLNTYGAVSLDRVHVMLGSTLGVSLSPATVLSMVRKTRANVSSTLDTIKEMLIDEPVANFDETGARVAGKLEWVHNASSKTMTYQTLSKNRGQKGMEESGVLPAFTNVAVHDCWASYWKYTEATHAICCAHLLRELTCIAECNPTHLWPILFYDLLVDMKRIVTKKAEQGKQAVSRYFQKKFSDKYRLILTLADRECPPPTVDQDDKRRVKRGKERALIDRLGKYEEEICRFTRDFRVPFDNNQAERDLRNIKTKIKVSGCFRTDAGCSDYLGIMSYLSTGRKHNVNPLDALSAAFSGSPDIVLS